MLLRPNVSVFRRLVAAMALSVLVGVTVTAQHTPAWADGTSWSPVDAAAQQQWRSVAYGNGVWVAVSTNGITNRVMRSPDNGATWTAVAATEDVNWRSVAYGNGVWVAISSDGTDQVMRSTDDGLSWSAVLATEGNNWESVAYGNGVWVAVSANGTTRVMRSVDPTASASADPGVPGIFLTVAGPVGRSASEAPIYYGANRVSVTSTYLLTVTGVSNIAPTITTLAEGTIDADGSFSSMTRLPVLAPGVYNVRLVGTHVNGSTLQLTSQVTIGGVGEFTSIGANIPVIK